ncbi:MAG: YadA-like family protein, partial [Rhodoplanes sp.]
VATAAGAVAIGQTSQATGANAIAIGNGSVATGSIAVGNVASAANGGAAFGDNSVATGSLATAIGPGAQATFAGSTALGAGAVTNRANQVMIGTANATYTAPGITSAASLAAQSGSTYFVTSDLNGNLAVSSMSPANIVNSITTLEGSVSALQGSVAALQADVASLHTDVAKAFEGTAVAIALGGGYLPDNKRFAISTNWGTFRGENAASVVAHLRVNDFMVVNGGFASGFQHGGMGGRVGATFAW